MKVSSLSLVHKMIILLVLPAVTQAILVVVLISLDDKAARSAELAQQQSKSIKIIDEMLFDFGLTIGSLFTHVVGPGAHPDIGQEPVSAPQTALISSSAYRAKMSAKLSALRQTCTTKEEEAVVDRASALVGQQAAAIHDLESEPAWKQDEGTPPLSVLHKVRTLRNSLRSMGRFFEGYRKLLGYNYHRQEMYLVQEAEQRLAVRNYIVIVLGIQSLISLFLILWFSRSTAQRLKRLVENADALPHLKELPNQVVGGDELAHLDATLHEALSDLKSADSLKNNLLNMVAHDVRSPVASASLILSNLDREVPDFSPDSKRTAVEQLKNLLKTIGTLVDDLLTFQKADSGKMELSFSEFKIVELVQEIVDEVTPASAARGIVIATSVATERSIIADRVRVGQVLRNYLSNAIKFSQDASAIEITGVAIDNVLKLSVIDHGTGIPASNIQNLFEQFVQVQGPKTELGFGLGLHICKTIIDLHGGTVGVQSSPGQGAEFWFTLPFAEDA